MGRGGGGLQILPKSLQILLKRSADSGKKVYTFCQKRLQILKNVVFRFCEKSLQIRLKYRFCQNGITFLSKGVYRFCQKGL